MGKNLDKFVADLSDIQKFISDRKLISELAERTKVGTTTVYDTFKAKSFEELTGKKLEVYKNAIAMIEEIKSLPDRASAAIAM